jgi:hypothetical protein
VLRDYVEGLWEEDTRELVRQVARAAVGRTKEGKRERETVEEERRNAKRKDIGKEGGKEGGREGGKEGDLPVRTRNIPGWRGAPGLPGQGA